MFLNPFDEAEVKSIVLSLKTKASDNFIIQQNATHILGI